MSENKSNLRLPTCYYCDLPFDHDFDTVVNENTQRLFIGYHPCEKCNLYPTQNIIVLSNEAKEILRQNDPNLSHINDDTPGAYMPDKYVKELINEFTDQLIANNDHSGKGESND